MSPHEKKRRGHERSDWNLNWVLWGGITLVVSVALMLIGSWWVFKAFQYAAASRQLGTVTEQVLPSEPRLQVSPTADWDAMLRREQATLHSYGWIDRSRGIVRIPIEREMEMIAQHGFPATKASGEKTR